MVKRKFYTINEEVAKAANDANSMNDYAAGSATSGYRSQVEEAYKVVDQIAKKKPEQLARAEYMADKYSRKLASWYNNYYSNEASCPSVLVSGPANFPTKKKERQNSRRDSLNKEWNDLERYITKIKNLLYHTQPILSDDDRAVEKLETKLENLENLQNTMKAVNAYYRKNKTLEGCPDLTVEEIAAKTEEMNTSWHYEDKPFMSYELTNNNSNIHRVKERLESLKAEKSAETAEKEYDGFTVKENTENMRLQFLFEDKPSAGIRDLLKHHGFRWSPSEGAWQRQLTKNARYDAENIIKEIEKENG